MSSSFHPKPAFASAILALVVILFPQALCEAAPRDVLVPMRDGVRLATDVFLPDGSGPWPCVLSRTPYNKGGLRGAASPFVAQGYAFVAQDCRGRFASEGTYDPFRQDAEDGYDTLEWITREAWSNGRVGMFGASALGITANLAATQGHPALRCAYVIVAEGSARRNTVYTGGVYRKELNDGWLKSQRAENIIAETIRHPPGDRHWDWRELRDFHRRVSVPTYHVGGWFDIFAAGTIEHFSGLSQHGRGLAAGNQKLVMGPFAHGFLEGRLKFPKSDAASWLGQKEALRWFDRWLKDSKNGIDGEEPIQYYILGDPEDPKSPGNEWRSALSWPPPARPVSWFLQPDRELRRGIPAGEPGALSYDYDPRRPVPTVGGANLISGGKGPMDQRAIGERQDYLRFESEVLDAPIEIAGRVSADLYVASDAPDTDFAAKLVDVYPDGYEALLLDGILRARYREGLEREVFLKPNEVVAVEVDLGPIACVFNRGHRVALHVTSSNDPRFDPNPNTGKPLRADGEVRVARNSVHFGARQPSRLLLPVVREHGERRY
jgi:hypothetical protein